ncbi:MAG: hypothetical protein Q9188_003609 [Gyalolechia gomerana]
MASKPFSITGRQLASSRAHGLSTGGVNAVALTFVFAFLATIAVGLRLWVRRTKRVGVLLEDWLIVASLVWQRFAKLFAQTSLNLQSLIRFTVAFDGGLGWQTAQLTPKVLIRTSKYTLAGQTDWPIVNGLNKVSICLTFIRIFFTRTFRTVATIVYSLCIGWSIATILVGYLICTPFSQKWIPSDTGHCGSTTAAYVSLAVLDIILDITVFALPMPCLYKLQITKTTKIGLMATFALGLFTIVAGIMRLVAVIQLTSETDFVQAQVSNAYWIAIEGSVGIIVACAMIMRPLLDRVLAVLGRYWSQLPTINRGHRNTSDAKRAGNPARPLTERSFVLLQDSQERAIQDTSGRLGDSRKDFTRRASYEGF